MGQRAGQIGRSVAALAVAATWAVMALGAQPATQGSRNAAPPGAYITAEGWFAPPKPNITPPALPKEVTRAFVIPIREAITRKSIDGVSSMVAQCRARGAQLIIFDIATSDISPDAMYGFQRLLLDETKGIYTVAYVDREATGAGVMVALACDEIVVSPNAVIGNAMPAAIFSGADAELNRDKIESRMKSIIRTIAQDRGHSEVLGIGMVVHSPEVWLVRNVNTGELRLADGVAESGKVPKTPASTRPGASVPPTDAEWEYVVTIDGSGKPLTLTANQTLRVGLARFMAPTMADLEKHYNVVGQATVLTDESSTTTSTPAATTTSGPTRAEYPAAPPGAYVTADGWFPPVKPNITPPALPKEVTRAFVIPIREEITPKAYDAIYRKVARCRAGGAQLIILDMKTPGGRSDVMDNILRLLMDETKDIYTVAYVNPEAFSAGAVIALSCNEIVVCPSAVIGDAMPIMISSGGELVPMPKEERSKMESGMKGIIRTIAQNRGHSEILCEGMITLGIQVWLERKPATGELRLADAATDRGNVRNAPATTQPGAAPAPANAEWEYLATIDGPDTLVTLTGNEALRVGLSRYMAPTMEDVQRRYGVTVEPTVLEDTWSELLVEFLTSSTVTGALFFLGIFLAYMELNAPGHFVPGILAAICFAIIFGSRFLIGMSDWWQIALFVVGIVLIVVELVTFHTMGLLLVAGLMCCVVGLLAILAPHVPGTLPIPQTEMDWGIFKGGILGLGLGFIGAVVAAMLFARYLPRLPIAGKLVLAPVLVPSEAPVSEHAGFKEVQVGDVGVAETLCRPVGKVRFGDRLLNAASTGEFLQPGDRVKVLKRDGNRLIVEKV